MTALTRRTFLVSAAAAALAPARAERLDWRGPAMGGEARILLTGPRDRAEAALAAVAAEIRRLESLVSLHRADSQLSRLNREGRLALPAGELRRLLAAAEDWRRRTEGAFDARVQPLWTARAAGREAGPVARGAIGVSAAEATLPPGTALTLNGIAQGTVADRVAALLARHGFAAEAVDAGELRLGAGQGLTIRHAGLRLAPGAAPAAATSAPGALAFPGGGHHLFDPRTGRSPAHWRAVTVLAPTAEAADALSTAFAVSPPELLGDLVPAEVSAVATDPAGRVRIFGRPLRKA